MGTKKGKAVSRRFVGREALTEVRAIVRRPTRLLALWLPPLVMLLMWAVDVCGEWLCRVLPLRKPRP